MKTHSFPPNKPGERSDPTGLRSRYWRKVRRREAHRFFHMLPTVLSVSGVGKRNKETTRRPGLRSKNQD